jgi:hypothetical protein
VADPLDALGIVLELFSWIGVVGGIALLVPGLLRALVRRDQTTYDGVVVSVDDDRMSFRWMDAGGTLHEMTAHRDPGIDIGEGVEVHVSPPDSSRGRLDPVDHLGRTLRIVGGILLAIGVVAAVVSVVLLFV